jgi:hypothetical protein
MRTSIVVMLFRGALISVLSATADTTAKAAADR